MTNSRARLMSFVSVTDPVEVHPPANSLSELVQLSLKAHWWLTVRLDDDQIGEVHYVREDGRFLFRLCEGGEKYSTAVVANGVEWLLEKRVNARMPFTSLRG